jgi:hypothetical protein
MQQFVNITQAISSAAAVTKSLSLANRRRTAVDRVLATLQPILAAGKAPLTADELTFLNQSVLIRWWLDANQQAGFVNLPVPVQSLYSPQMGPIPVRPFVLKDTDQFTLEVSATNPALFTDAASPYVTKLSALNVVFILYGNDDRKL